MSYLMMIFYVSQLFLETFQRNLSNHVQSNVYLIFFQPSILRYIHNVYVLHMLPQ